jgi:tetratricopeptide (TPR) repeat protein
MQRSALEISRKVFGAESKESAAALNELGLTDWREGKQAEAETNDLQALAIWRQLDGDESPEVAISLDNLADVYRHYSRPKEAEPLARQALAINQKLFGKDSLEAADSLRILCILMGDEGKWTESEALGREVLAIRIKRLKPNDPLVAASLTDVGWAASNMGKWDEAESLENQALALRQKILGNEHPEVADSFSRLGNYMQKSGDLKQAYADLNSALAIRRKILKQDDPTLIYNLRCLGSVLEDQGKLAEAEEMYQEALNSWIKRNDDPNQMLGELQNVVRVLIKEQKLGDANQLLNKMLSPEIVRPSTAAPLLFQRATIEARQNLWQKAADDALLAFKHDPWNSSQYSMVAGLLIKSHNTNAYDLLRKRLLADNARTTDMFTADQVAKSCLFLPPPESDLKAIIRLADMAVTRGIHDKGAMPFFEVCKALAEYRVGHFSEAAKWAQKSIDSPREDAHPHAYGVLALAEWRLENTEQAREALAVDEKLAPREMPTAVAHDPGTAWLSWLFARIQLTEAESLMNHSTPAVNESNPQ